MTLPSEERRSLQGHGQGGELGRVPDGRVRRAGARLAKKRGALSKDLRPALTPVSCDFTNSVRFPSEERRRITTRRSLRPREDENRSVWKDTASSLPEVERHQTGE